MKLTKDNVPQPPKKSLTPIILIIAIVLVIIAVSIAIIIFAFSNSVSESLTSTSGTTSHSQAQASQSVVSEDTEASKTTNEIRSEKYDNKTNLLEFINNETPDYTCSERFSLSLTYYDSTITADIPLIDGYQIENAMGTSYIEYYLNPTSSMTTNDLISGKIQIVSGNTVHSDYEWYQNEGCYVEEKTISTNAGDTHILLIWEGEDNGYYRQFMYRVAVPLIDGYFLAFSTESFSPDYDEEALYTIKYIADNLILTADNLHTNAQ